MPTFRIDFLSILQKNFIIQYAKIIRSLSRKKLHLQNAAWPRENWKLCTCYHGKPNILRSRAPERARGLIFCYREELKILEFALTRPCKNCYLLWRKNHTFCDLQNGYSACWPRSISSMLTCKNCSSAVAESFKFWNLRLLGLRPHKNC